MEQNKHKFFFCNVAKFRKIIKFQMNEIKIQLQKDSHSIVTALASTIQLATSNVHSRVGTICKSHLNKLNNNLKFMYSEKAT